MASVGLFVDLNLKVTENVQVQQVREDILEKLGKTAVRVDIYRMSPLRAFEDVSPTDFLVAHIPQLPSQNVRQESHDLVVARLTSRIEELSGRLMQSERARQEAVVAIDALNDQILAMIEEMNCNRRELQSPVTRHVESILDRSQLRKQDIGPRPYTSKQPQLM
jgi:cell division protein FtsI/penicillin-binding protein 2